MKIIVLLFLVVFATSKYVRQNHDYWYTAARKSAQTHVAFADVAWNYCDYKCIYLQSLYTNYDFFVVNFKDAWYKPNFSVCYAQKISGGQPVLWNKVAANGFFEKNCGGDNEDYLKKGQKQVISKQGQGDTPIDY